MFTVTRGPLSCRLVVCMWSNFFDIPTFFGKSTQQ
ncbi:hypothetical protein T4D_6483 [Trichinella pseudospiralis]|uniref:Uncharacterized protein n=1 Tax=Trichinella pseudospiralis TaxID=6337 RepID=A0A0V1C3M1_TRIPS|nr:hypothetical protein T4D_6483 [Trichinella pseudospiralis]